MFSLTAPSPLPVNRNTHGLFLQLSFCGMDPQPLRCQAKDSTIAPHHWDPRGLWTGSESCSRLHVFNGGGLGMKVLGPFIMKACSVPFSSTPDQEHHQIWTLLEWVPIPLRMLLLLCCKGREPDYHFLLFHCSFMSDELFMMTKFRTFSLVKDCPHRFVKVCSRPIVKWH